MSDITIAASARAFDELFAELVENVKINESDTETWGPFSANYDLAIHLQGGSLTLNAGTFTVEDLDIVFDDLEVGVCFSLPQWCFGGWCIIPTPFGCIRFPHICIGGESICPSINLDGLVTQIVNFTAGLATNYWVNPARLASWSDLEAEINNKPNYWQLIVEPTLVDIDPLDVAATAADLFESAVKSAIESLISYLPNWVIDIIWTLIGPIVDRSLAFSGSSATSAIGFRISSMAPATSKSSKSLRRPSRTTSPARIRSTRSRIPPPCSQPTTGSCLLRFRSGTWRS